MSKEKKSQKKKMLFNNSIMSIIFMIIVVLSYIGLAYLIVYVIDLPEENILNRAIYSLSDETKEKLKGLEREVKIEAFNYSEDSEVGKVLRKYEEESEQIKVEFIPNISENMLRAREIGITRTDMGVIHFESGENEANILSEDIYNELYTVDYETNELVNKVEEKVTNAIISVITDVKPEVVIYTKHAEMDPNQYFISVMNDLEAEGSDVKLLVDEEENENEKENTTFISGDLLIIPGLKEDITEIEKEEIMEYIKNGGNLLITQGETIEEVEMPNFRSILSEYGITLEKGILHEEEPKNLISSTNLEYLIESVIPNSTTKNIDMNLKIFMFNTAALTLEEDEEKLAELGVNHEVLMKTSKRAYIRTDFEQYNETTKQYEYYHTDKDSDYGEYNLGVLATKKLEDGNESKLIIYGSSEIGIDEKIYIKGQWTYISALLNNRDVLANSVAYLNNMENIISVREKTNYSYIDYVVTEEQDAKIRAIIFAIPIIIIIIGIIVWTVRIRKN